MNNRTCCYTPGPKYTVFSFSVYSLCRIYKQMQRIMMSVCFYGVLSVLSYPEIYYAILNRRFDVLRQRSDYYVLKLLAGLYTEINLLICCQISK